MKTTSSLDCIVIGYHEPPFDTYEQLIRNFGEQSPAYRDLQFSFVRSNNRALNYVDLLNLAYERARPSKVTADSGAVFKSGDIPNLAAAYLTSFLRKQGFHTKCVNLFDHEKELLSELLAENPLCVAITTTFYVINWPVVEMVRFIREKNPDVKIIVGGPLIANHFRNYRTLNVRGAGNSTDRPAKEDRSDPLSSALADVGADIYVIEAQGELTLARVLGALKKRTALRGVPNLAFFENGKLCVTTAMPENNSLDENVIAWEQLTDLKLGRTVQTRTARSCAFNCAFCNYPARAGKLALAGLGAIKRELDSIRAVGTVRNVVFIDDTFNVPLDRFKDICRLLIDSEYGFNWFSYFRCSNADEEAVELMAKSGCKGVFLGIESGSPEILKRMDKAATIEKYARGIRWLKERGILTFASFIVGFPGETAGTINETVEFIRSNQPDYYRVQLWYCEPGTPIEQRREENAIQGYGFMWNHATMDSFEALDHIDRMFLQIRESLWLPQWSFDFWIIPYLLGRGITPESFKQFMTAADRLLALEIASVAPDEKARKWKEHLGSLVATAAAWPDLT